MGNTLRWWHKPHTRFRLKLDEYYDNDPIKHWKEYNPFYHRHENKSFRVEQHKKVRHQNKILLNKNLCPDKTIEHTQGWGSN